MTKEKNEKGISGSEAMKNLVVFSTLSRFPYKPFGFNAILCCKNAVVPWMKGDFERSCP